MIRFSYFYTKSAQNKIVSVIIDIKFMCKLVSKLPNFYQFLLQLALRMFIYVVKLWKNVPPTPAKGTRLQQHSIRIIYHRSCLYYWCCLSSSFVKLFTEKYFVIVTQNVVNKWLYSWHITTTHNVFHWNLDNIVGVKSNQISYFYFPHERNENPPNIS